ncbi:hypothetical protein TSUD_306930 [Trifolium subterraneum]|uniref:F-box domain-containing protein n=1 Tax=Trifolium subterraneum TaxID=3900 RepID=A0A2Z6PE27_TRISU|nr:hypothetical protein TSUD_306930 [Trifolium subterraneum]
MDSFFGIPSKYSGRVPSRKRKRNLPSSLDQQRDCIVCFDGNDFVLCDRRECPNPYHPSCVKRDNNLVHVKENLNCDTGGGEFPYSTIGEDKISDMPDSLLHHILSFLRIEDAATTSILSKRWRSLWFSQLVLDFDDEPFLDASTFCNFVYSFMAMRDITLPIISFQLKCCSCFYKKEHKEDIYNFVYIAIQRRVENLYIDLSYSFTLPYFVLSSKTLSVLKLTRITVNDIPYVHLPSLKVLHLERVTFTYYEYILKLLSGCPVLQDLGTEDLLVTSPYLERPLKSLSNLLKANICNTHIEFDWLHNVERLRAMVV